MPTSAKHRHSGAVEALLWATWMLAAPVAALARLSRRAGRWCVEAGADISAAATRRRGDTPKEMPSWFVATLVLLSIVLVLVVVW